ncbi:DUF6262 family protein [Actinoallomurus sp. NPDC052308]|uniref:DUF6262 family protein n=1 Tax=Actinoallomurus sp. NPDC052308 TaxID=3155530 RepID=UPI0034489EA0
MTPTNSTPTAAANKTLVDGRRADTARRRQRALKAINDAIAAGEEVSVSAIARKAGIDRSFFYRSQHKDLLAQIHTAGAEPPIRAGVGPTVTRASLKADLANCQERCARLAARVQQLEKRLSRALGEQTWREAGLGAPDDIENLKQKIIILDA